MGIDGAVTLSRPGLLYKYLSRRSCCPLSLPSVPSVYHSLCLQPLYSRTRESQDLAAMHLFAALSASALVTLSLLQPVYGSLRDQLTAAGISALYPGGASTSRLGPDQRLMASAASVVRPVVRDSRHSFQQTVHLRPGRDSLPDLEQTGVRCGTSCAVVAPVSSGDLSRFHVRSMPASAQRSTVRRRVSP